MAASLPGGEAERLAVLQDHQILDTAPEEGFDDLVRLAAQICGVPIAIVSLVDEHRQWFKSVLGLDIQETTRDAAFCAHTILQPDLLVIPDARTDARFVDNPLVTGDPHIRFYAGVPLLTEEGYALGSLCVIDRTPRVLTPEQAETLRLLARQVASHLRAARRVAAQERLVAEQQRLVAEREQILAEKECLVLEKERLAAEREREAAGRLFAEAERLRLAAIIDTCDDAVYSMTLRGTITSWNHGSERLYGYAAAQVIGRRVNMLVPSEHRAELGHILRAVRRAEDVAPLETVRLTAAGTPIDVSLRFSPITGAGGRVVGASVIARDITQRKQTEAALEAEREFTHALLESLQEGIVACDARGTLNLFNRATREMHGLPEQPLPPEAWAAHFDLYAADGLTPMPTHEIPLFRAFQGETVRDAEMVIAPKFGPARTVLASGQAIYGADGRKLGAVAAMHDVTEKRQIQRELSRLAAIVESSEEAILAATLDGTLVSWNRGAEKLYGYAAAEMVGRSAGVLAGPDQTSPVPAVVTRLIRGETVEAVEVLRMRRDGTEFHAALSFSPIRDAAGHMIGLSCIARDITARKQAEAALAESSAALRESESRLRRFAEAAFEGIAISQDGRLVEVSPAFATKFGYDAPERMVGLAAAELAAPESRSLAARHIMTCSEEPYEATLMRRDGTTFQAELRGRLTHLGGRPARVTAVRDISARKAMEAALRAGNAALQESQAFIQAVADNSTSLIHVFDLETRGNVYANRSLGELLGYAPEEVAALGADLLPAMAHPDDLPRVLAHFDEFDQVADGQVVEFEYRARHAGGEWRWVWNREVIFKRHEDGRPWQILGNAQDVTERRHQEEALRRSEAGLRAVLESAPIILYAADADGTVTLSEGTGLAGLGLKPGEAVGRSLFEFSGGDAVLEENTRRGLAGEALSYDARMSGLCLHTEVRPLRDAQGAVTGIIGVCFDLTERARAEERFRVLFEQSSDAHLLCGGGGILDCNDATLSLLRCGDRAQLLAIHPAVFSPEFQPDGRRSDEKGTAMEALARERGSHRFEWMHRKLDGEEFPVEVSLTPVTLADGPALLAVLHDLTDRKRAEEVILDHAIVLEFQKHQLEVANRELEALATTDGLTGLTNHRAFQERLTEEVRRAERYGTPLSVIFLDVDHFKQYNDRYGHPKGDDVLRRIAGLLRASARETDLVARYGGEEFVIALPHTNGDAALAVAERARTAITAAAWPLCPVTASLGVAALRQGVDSSGDLIARADQALYRAKKDGRNRVAVAVAGGREISLI